MSLFLFDTPPDFVQEELERRRVDRSSSFGGPTYSQKPKSPWMRMISGFKPNEGKRRMLAGGDLSLEQNLEFGFKGMYERSSGTGERYRPEPAIESISVDEKLQSFECTVEWTANSIGQLDRLFPYFMNLGTSIIVDWGWDDVDPSVILDATDEQAFANQFKRVDAETEIDSQDQKNPYDTTKFDKFAKSNGRYCFVAGSIVDFSYSPDENGTYSCTTDIMSLSKAMRKLRTQAQENPRKIRTKSPEDKPYLYEWLKKSFIGHLRKNSENKGDIVAFGQGASNDDEQLDYGESGRQNTGYYVAWREIERIVNTYASLTKDGESREPKSGPYGNPATLTLDSADSIVSSFNEGGGEPPLNLRTKDPLRCILDVGVGSEKFRNFTKKPEEASADLSLSKESRQGYLYNLYINFNLIQIAFQTHDAIFDALEYILEEASSACFDIWNFSIEVNGNTIEVIDKNMTAGKSVEDYMNDGDKEEGTSNFTFRPNTEKTVLRGFNFDTNLDDKMKAQIVAQKSQEAQKTTGPSVQEFIDESFQDGQKEEEKITFSSANASEEEQKNPAVNAKNDSTAKLFGKKYTGRDIAISPLKKPENAQKASTSESGDGSQSNSKPFNVQSLEKINDSSIDSEDAEQRRKLAKKNIPAQGASKKYLIYKNEQEGESKAQEFAAVMQGDTDKLSSTNGNNVLGMGAQLEFAGISGFTAYQVIDIKQIPKIFENNGLFTVESVSHSVSIDDWSTEIKTSFVVGNLLNGVK